VRPAGPCPARPLREAVIRYLEAAGWRREPVTWRGVGLWSLPGDDERELLAPLEPGLRDEAQRLREAVGVLAAVEGRPVSEVGRDVAPHLWAAREPGDGAEVVVRSGSGGYGLSVDVGRCGGCGVALAAVGPHGSERADERRVWFELDGAELAGGEGGR
jgi:hypothetical protein